MEYAAGGELFERICTAGRFSEDEVALDPAYLPHYIIWLCSLIIRSSNRYNLCATCVNRQGTSFSSYFQGSATAIPWYALLIENLQCKQMAELFP